ncbi:MAG: MerR family transcriptional regulator [Hyphomicrobiales bacterium]|nr:MAG: MerR family transcriptional regulator [Hyphomicrobiales bacterium]
MPSLEQLLNCAKLFIVIPRGLAMYSISAVCRLTGLNSSTIRTWERRYGIPEVARAGNGRRLYTEDQVQYLKAVADLVAQGHAISDIAGLTLPQIQDAMAKGEAREAEPRSPYHERLIELLRRNDVIGFRRLLSDAIAFLAPCEVVGTVIGPVMREIGVRWERGELSIFQEHMATAVTRQLLLTAAGSWRGAQSGRRLVFTTLEGDQHEIGILCAWYITSASNFDAVYLGPSLPNAEIAQAAKLFKADAVVISVASSERPQQQVKAIERLHKMLKGTAALWVGGPMHHPLHQAVAGTDVVAFDRFDGFQRYLFRA